jgi:hypothetical protein
MNWISSLFGKIKRFFAPEFGNRIVEGVRVAAPYIETAYELVQAAAAAAPNKRLDQLLIAAQTLGVPALWRSDDPGSALREIVVMALRKKFPGVPDRVLNRAIELAYGAIRP